MTNDKNNMNELVTDDDDPTAELEALTLESADDLSESAAATFDFINAQDRTTDASITELKSDLKSRSETIDRLQYDIEQLRAKWTGLELEIKAREELTTKLNVELEKSTDILVRKERLIKKRDQTIRSLKTEIRSRNGNYEELNASLLAHEQRIEQLQKELAADRSDEAKQNTELLQQQAGRIASAEIEINDLRAQLQRTESYADSIRQQLQDRTRDTDEADDTREFLQSSLRNTAEHVAELKAELKEVQQLNAKLTDEIVALKAAHADEVRMIRFELSEAQETVAQHGLVAEQLASDLVDTRSFKDELEQMLSESKEDSQSRIEHLEKENQRLAREAAEIREKLETKSEAINCLLAELAKKSQQIEAIGEIGNVIHEIDNRMSERIDDRSGKDRDRVTRLLIGTVEGQELRFPLFKDRLTIGRTDQNDIHLDASYVSRRHAVVVTDGDATRIIDWGSKNGVFVNSKRITEHFLQSGDTVTIGTANFRYEERPKRDA
jgi:chromosome segregation ATPase